MVSYTLRRTLAKGYLFVANIICTVQIDNLVVPELVQSGSNVILDCQYSVPGDRVTVQWLHTTNTSETTIYQWSPHTAPIVGEILQDRLDLSFKISRIPSQEGRAIRIFDIDPELSGNYTCVVTHGGVRTSQSKMMIVFSPEKDLTLNIDHIGLTSYQITCSTHGVYPQPDLILEYNDAPISQQWQKVWKSRNNLYYAETRAQATPSECENQMTVTCRLSLPRADYTAITKKLISFETRCNGDWSFRPLQTYVVLLIASAASICILTIH